MADYPVVIKRLEPQLVAAVQGKSPDTASLKTVFPGLFGEAYAHVMKHGGALAGPGLARYLGGGDCDTDWLIEACVPISQAVPATERVKVYTVAGTDTAACTVHRGPFDGLGNAFEAVGNWITANGYRICGPGREVYLQFDPHGDPATYVTEVQYPVMKP